MEELIQEPTAPGHKAPFQHLSRSKVRAVLNCLTESTFFYREDDPDLFEYLRRQRSEFTRFFEEWFGWDLHVDRKCARLFKREQHNPALTRKQRSLFDLTRRDECVLFMLLLEFHELQLAALNVHFEHDEDLCFELAEFVRHALQHFRRELGEKAPGDRELFGSIQSLFRELERHRFLELVERADLREGEALPAGQTERILYAFRPGLHCYDPGRLNAGVFAHAYGELAAATEGATPQNGDVDGDADGDADGGEDSAA